MNQFAIFVDAGYLFAQGAVALTGEKQKRNDLSLDVDAIKTLLVDTAKSVVPDARLLRIYWYDAPTASGWSMEHQTLAQTNDLKLRLGLLNNVGQQKGVDALILTDMIDLARNHSICDVILLSGDADVLVGVQLVQSLGVRVHLLGIHPSRGSQARLLIEEVDTRTELSPEQVMEFLSLKVAPAWLPTAGITVGATPSSEVAPPERGGELVAVLETPAPRVTVEPQPLGHASPEDLLRLATESVFDALSEIDRNLVKQEITLEGFVPRHIDGLLIVTASRQMDRDLYQDEKRQVRAMFRKLLK